MEKTKKSFFQIKEKGSTVTREILAGLVVFFAMIYILPTNVGILSAAGMNPTAVFIATALASGIATLIMGLIARFPIALSAGMGLNAFFAYTVCLTMGYSWGQALTITLVAAIIFIIITITPIRKMIIEAIPKSLKSAIITGLGCFIAFVGLKNMGLIAGNDATLVTLAKFNNPAVLLGIFGIILVITIYNLNGKISKFAIAIAMMITALVGFLLGVMGVDGMPAFDFSQNPITGISSIKEIFGQAFLHFDILLDPKIYAIIFSFIFVNLFDTTATLLAVGKGAGAIDEEGKLIGGQKVMLADAGGALISGILGVSPVTSFAESNTGIEMGGRTGLTAVTVGILFLLSIFAYPIFSIFTNYAVTAMALVAIGGMMFVNIKDIDWDDKIIVFTTFIIILFMVVTYSISHGIGLGLISYSIMMLVSKRGKEVKPVLYVIAAMYIISYIVDALILMN